MTANLSSLEQPTGAGVKSTILVVEDEFVIRMMLTEQLEEIGYAVIGASDADEALSKMNATLPQLMITDIRMPGSIDGLGLLKKVREIHVTLPVIIVSAHLNYLDAIDRRTVFCMKPYKFSEIARNVEVLLKADLRF